MICLRVSFLPHYCCILRGRHRICNLDNHNRILAPRPCRNILLLYPSNRKNVCCTSMDSLNLCHRPVNTSLSSLPPSRRLSQPLPWPFELPHLIPSRQLH